MTTTPEGRFDAIRNRGVAVAVLIAAATVLLIGTLAPADASAATKWLCKPGVKPDPCKGSLKTTVFDSAGNSEVRTAKNAHRPKYDCFYVYPTVSEQPTPNANKHIDPQQTSIAQYQAARYSEDCKVYAPVYRQATLAGISDPESVDPNSFAIAYKDVLAAWKNYLRRLQQGPRRGPDRPLPGCRHAQPAAQQRDREAQVAAQAAGLGDPARRQRDDPQGQGPRRHVQEDPPLPLRQADRLRDRVLDLQRRPHRPTRSSAAPTARSRRCRPARTRPTTRSPARTRPPSAAALRPLETIARSEPFPGTLGIGITIMYGGPAPSADTPWITPQDHYTARCDYTDGASSLMLSSVDGAKVLTPSPTPGWGLHLLDANVALGNLIDIVHSQGKRYLKQH